MNTEFFFLKHCPQTQRKSVHFENILGLICITPNCVRGPCQLRTKKGALGSYLGNLPPAWTLQGHREQLLHCSQYLGTAAYSLVCPIKKSMIFKWFEAGVSKMKPMGHLYLCLRSLWMKNNLLFFLLNDEKKFSEYYETWSSSFNFNNRV